MAEQAKSDWQPLWAGFALLPLLTGCATPEAIVPVTDHSATLERRLADLEHRVQRLENRPSVAAPQRNQEEVQGQIGQLEAERTALLLRYTEQHPAIRNIDRKLHILREQARLLEP